jgi:hypothetical protein
MIEAQRASITKPHEHPYIGHERAFSVWAVST